MSVTCPKCAHKFDPPRTLYPVKGFPHKAYMGPQCRKKVYRYGKSAGKQRCRLSGKHDGYCRYHRKKEK